MLLPINVWPMNGHVFLGIGQRLKAELRVKPMCVFCGQQHPAQALQMRMGEDRPQQQFGDAPAAMLRHDEDIRQIRERGAVSNDARKANLSLLNEGAKAKGVFDGPLNHVAGNALRPIR